MNLTDLFLKYLYIVAIGHGKPENQGSQGISLAGEVRILKKRILQNSGNFYTRHFKELWSIIN